MRSQALSGMHLQSHWAPCATQGCTPRTQTPTGMYPAHTNPQGCGAFWLRTQTPNKNAPPQPFSPIPGCIFFVLYVLPKTAKHKRECSPGAGLKPSGFLLPCGQAVSCCLATSVVRSRGPAQSFSRPGHVSPRHESGLHTIPLLGILACAAPR